jgi:hypothetical protein
VVIPLGQEATCSKARVRAHIAEAAFHWDRRWGSVKRIPVFETGKQNLAE